MNPILSQQYVDVFPIVDGPFGFARNWFGEYLPKLVHPTYLLMTLLLVISIGIMVLKRFENNTLEQKLWNLPIIIIIVAFWPTLVLGLKTLIDAFNTFLVTDIFQIPWKGIGFPSFSSLSLDSIFGWSTKALISLLPTLSYWIIYAFFMLFFFFYAVLGPFVLAKGILYDEIDAFLDVVREITILFLWQTTVVILVASIMPEIVSGQPYAAVSSLEANILFLSIILCIMFLFVPSVTRKFAEHVGASFFPPILKAGAAITAGALFTKSLRGIGATKIANGLEGRGHHVLTVNEYQKRAKFQDQIYDLEDENYYLKDEMESAAENSRDDDEARKEKKEDPLVNLSQKAKDEVSRRDDENE